MRKIPTLLNLDQYILDWLKAESERRGTPMSKIVRDLLIREMNAMKVPE